MSSIFSSSHCGLPDDFGTVTASVCLGWAFGTGSRVERGHNHVTAYGSGAGARVHGTGTWRRSREQILRNNDVQLFDLKNDPFEMHNLALGPEKNHDPILRMNGLLNQLMAKEAGTNDGSFMPAVIRPKSQ